MLQLLGENYIKQMKQDLTPLTFQTSILCQRIGIAKDGFYSSMREGHKYDSSNFSRLDALFHDREKLAESEEDLLEHRTDGSDAFDVLYIGCEKFPYRESFFKFGPNFI